jgi:hypothetical protein
MISAIVGRMPEYLPLYCPVNCQLIKKPAWWQLYHHLFPEKARIVQCYYSPFRYSCGATRRYATDSPSSPIAAFLASNLLAQFFSSFSRQKII